MHLNFPKKQVTVNIHTKHAEYLEAQAIKEDRTPDNIVMSALSWYQLVMETEGAREAVQALRPQLSKMPPMPTMVELAQAIENLEKE
jgi:hypothetical protein